MFTSKVPAVLKSVSLDSKDAWRIAHCQFHIVLDYELAKQVSAKVADRLFRLSGVSEFVPCLELHHVVFEDDDYQIEPQILEFHALPEMPSLGRFPGVEVLKLEAVRLKHSEVLTLALSLRFRFLVPQSGMAKALLIDLLKQSVFLSFRPMQQKLPLDAKDEAGRFVNERSVKARA